MQQKRLYTLSGSCAAEQTAATPALQVPEEYLCPVSHAAMRDPVVAPSGITFDRGSLERWLRDHETDPITQDRLAARDLYPNLDLRESILGFARAHQ